MRPPLGGVLPLPLQLVATLGDADRIVLLMHERGARFADFKERASGPALAERTYRIRGEGMRVTGQFAQGDDDPVIFARQRDGGRWDLVHSTEQHITLAVLSCHRKP